MAKSMSGKKTMHMKQDGSSPKVGAKMGLAGGKYGTKTALTKKN